MGNYLLVIAGILMSFNLFSISLKANTANRTIINTPKSIFESSISLYTPTNEQLLQFDSTKLKRKLTSYYDNCFEDKNIDYSMFIQTYDQGNNDIPRYGKANGVRVIVTANCGTFCKIRRTLKYEIRSGAYGYE